MEVPKLFEIRNKKSGELWVASSRKKVWKKAHHAKCAWILSEGVHFDDQNDYEIVDLSTPIGDYIEKSRNLLEECLMLIENEELHNKVFKFLKG